MIPYNFVGNKLSKFKFVCGRAPYLTLGEGRFQGMQGGMDQREKGKDIDNTGRCGYHSAQFSLLFISALQPLEQARFGPPQSGEQPGRTRQLEGSLR